MILSDGVREPILDLHGAFVELARICQKKKKNFFGLYMATDKLLFFFN